MFYFINWTFFVFLLTCWTVFLWGVDALFRWISTHSSSLNASSESLQGLVFPSWLTYWLPTGFGSLLRETLVSLEPVVSAVLNATPALAGMVNDLFWIIWGLGCFVLIFLACAGHFLVSRWLAKHGRFDRLKRRSF